MGQKRDGPGTRDRGRQHRGRKGVQKRKGGDLEDCFFADTTGRPRALPFWYTGLRNGTTSSESSIEVNFDCKRLELRNKLRKNSCFKLIRRTYFIHLAIIQRHNHEIGNTLILK